MTPSYPHTLHWPASLTIHRDDKYHLDPAFFVDRDVVITEKMDGGITTISQRNAYARSSEAATHLPWFDYMKGRTLPKFYNLPDHLCPIGEDLYGVHSIQYDPLPDTFFLFHVLDRQPDNVGTEHTAGDMFWAWNLVEEFARQFGVYTVPVLYRGRFDQIAHITEFFMDNIGRPSIYGPNREGFVIREAGSFPLDSFGTHVAKFVRKNHVQTDEHWTRHWKPARLQKWQTL